MTCEFPKRIRSAKKMIPALFSLADRSGLSIGYQEIITDICPNLERLDAVFAASVAREAINAAPVIGLGAMAA
jgi:hypothetical protein